MRFSNKVAVVTGGSRGIGAACVTALRRNGAGVRSLSRLQGDLSKVEDVNRMVSDALDIFGRIDILINNAGILGPIKPLKDYTPEEWDYVLGTNLHGVAYITSPIVRHMIDKEIEGHIVMLESYLGDYCLPNVGAYAASKAALMCYTKTLAAELEPYKIRVNGLEPGMVNTGMQEELRRDLTLLPPRMLTSLQAKWNLGMRSPESVAECILDLCDCNFTGRIIR